ncbi:hypothetical protein UFOVP899_15 [uncultured Caudovirales phage]|uniref:Uncharacterized protein n=1 Tax=uncultured Caudovirales phage TaxID=2100421 RepID=A0A6J7XB64_9CAUD|nr:hypothetical protein UFOVP899_15 [uncultured Caudovirales phage]CAB4176214.1 hypothetical protein UFOVP987_14 [uncultured Caudovirales phage]CAB4180853.1 hypothetical protein UFOVP1074_23 [uncultured Caudovirales phage]CAB4198329.1 hypothetical protein UFOVP1310_58 [uncultured Caudovirales phage]CAB4210409.1 hypothetical protein UFOVP1424_14 [uncultured Caudovirales phage]
MSLRQYSYRDTLYFFNAEKINVITPNTATNVFVFSFDNQKLLNIGFSSYNEGVTWIHDNIINPSLVGEIQEDPSL